MSIREINPKIVHFMQYGHTLCGMLGVPIDWPADHFWVGKAEGWEHVNCEACLKLKPKE